jgi:cardiolipin synthase
MKAAGVKWARYRPLHFYSLRRPGIRTHRKLLIVDGRIGYTGGLGIDKRWLGNARDKNEWRDTQVRVTGPVVAQMQAIFSENWTFTRGKILAGDAFYPPAEHTGTMLAQAIKSSKGDASSLPKMMYFIAIRSAKRYIHIQNAYFIPDEQVRAELIAAVKRGVDVQVMVPGMHNDLPVMRQASRAHYGELLRGGVKIFEYVPTMLHNKTVVVDDVFSTIGSINFDARSMGVNCEESLSLYDTAFAKEMEAMFQRDKRVAKRSLPPVGTRGFTYRFAESLSWILEPYY